MSSLERTIRDAQTHPSGSLSAAWDEGYVTCLWDFKIQRTTEQAILASTNPHGDRIARRNLADYERHEIRNALTFHFGHECGGNLDEIDTTAGIVEAVVMRILARRPERGA